MANASRRTETAASSASWLCSRMLFARSSSRLLMKLGRLLAWATSTVCGSKVGRRRTVSRHLGAMLAASARLSGPLRRLHGAACRAPLAPTATRAFGSLALLPRGTALGAPHAAAHAPGRVAALPAALPLAPLHAAAPPVLRLASRGFCSSADEAEDASSGRPFSGAILDGKPGAFLYMESPVRAMTRRLPTLARTVRCAFAPPTEPSPEATRVVLPTATSHQDRWLPCCAASSPFCQHDDEGRQEADGAHDPLGGDAPNPQHAPGPASGEAALRQRL